MTTSESRSSGEVTATGPLMVSAANPRYFTAATGQRAVYVTGSHIWSNLHDGMGPGQACAEAPERFDYDAYLDFLANHGHNFIRLWRWEQFGSQAAGGDFHLCMAPQPWPRTGPGVAREPEAPRSESSPPGLCRSSGRGLPGDGHASGDRLRRVRRLGAVESGASDGERVHADPGRGLP